MTECFAYLRFHRTQIFTDAPQTLPHALERENADQVGAW